MNAKNLCFLKTFFESCKEKLEKPEITVCMGNEACDSDSFVSSIATAAS